MSFSRLRFHSGDGCFQFQRLLIWLCEASTALVFSKNMSVLQPPACLLASQTLSPPQLSIYLHSILIQLWRKADLLVRGSTSIHYLMGERLQTVKAATEVSDTLHWPGQRRDAWLNTNMLSHLLHYAWAALNPPAHDLADPSPITILPPFSGIKNPAGETMFHFPEACSAGAGL